MNRDERAALAARLRGLNDGELGAVTTQVIAVYRGSGWPAKGRLMPLYVACLEECERREPARWPGGKRNGAPRGGLWLRCLRRRQRRRRARPGDVESLPRDPVGAAPGVTT